MSQEERTYKRDLTFSQWHRTLGSGCPAIDVDWLEYCPCNKILALIEDARDGGQRKSSYKTAALAKLAGVPAYVVLYQAEMPNVDSCPACGHIPQCVGRVTGARIQQITPNPSGWQQLTTPQLAEWYKNTVHKCPGCGVVPSEATIKSTA